MPATKTRKMAFAILVGTEGSNDFRLVKDGLGSMKDATAYLKGDAAGELGNSDLVIVAGIRRRGKIKRVSSVRFTKD